MGKRLAPEVLAQCKALYDSGLSIAEVAAATGRSFSGAQRVLYMAGTAMRSTSAGSARAGQRRRAAIGDEVVRRYQDGESELAIARTFNLSRAVIRGILDDRGTVVRGRSEANALRLEREGPEGRRRLASAANAARREQGVTTNELLLRAAAAAYTGSLVALGERDLAELLRKRGLNPVPQRAVASYNVDLALDPVAVEVHRQTSHPMRTAQLRRRADALVAAGWRVLYVWCAQGVRSGPGITCFAERCGDVVADHIALARINAQAVRECRIIRCTGEDAP